MKLWPLVKFNHLSYLAVEPLKLDCAVCAVKSIKVMMLFVYLSHISYFDYLNYFNQLTTILKSVQLTCLGWFHYLASRNNENSFRAIKLLFFSPVKIGCAIFLQSSWSVWARLFKLCSWTDYAGWELCSVEAFKPCDVLRPIKPDCAVCAVDPIKLVLNFFPL